MVTIKLMLSNNNEREYNLTLHEDVTKFKRIITQSINGKKKGRLKEAVNQLRQLGDNAVAQQQRQRIQTALDSMNSIMVKIENNKNTSMSAEPDSVVIYDESGENSFQELYAHLLQDMQNYSGNITFLSSYCAIVVSFFIHMATFTPTQGNGKAQQREFDHKSQLQYFRSQGNHAQAKLFRKLIKTRNESKSRSRLPLNLGFVKLLKNYSSDNVCKVIHKFDPKTGKPKSGQKVKSHASLQIAHAGARLNSLSALVNGMVMSTEDSKDEKKPQVLMKILKHELKPVTSKIKHLDSKTLRNRINALLKNFSTPDPITESKTPLSSRLLSYRINRIQQIKESASKFKLQHISLSFTPYLSTCLMIRIYPACNKSTCTYKEGVTNVLLSIFSAMINNQLRQNDEQIYIERRQSFGFLRPTVTDAGNLMIRLSLGLEPTSFDAVVLQCLKYFDAVLNTFNFQVCDDKLVKKTFEIMPSNQGGESKRQKDSYILNRVRKDNRTLETYRQADAYISAETKTGEGEVGCLTNKVGKFLKEYIVEGKTIDNYNLPKQKAKKTLQTIASPIIDLLKNTLNYARELVSKMTLLDNREPLDDFIHSFYHSLNKLYLNCKEAQYLLDNQGKTHADIFYKKSNLLIENILEYLISLDSLWNIRLARIKGDEELLVNEVISSLYQDEIERYSDFFSITDKSRLHCFFTDSGQQAITATLIVMSVVLNNESADGKYYDNDIHLFGKPYFEVNSFFGDNKNANIINEMTVLEKAKIVFIDITQINKISLKDCKAMMALVIDMTHHPELDQELLRRLVEETQSMNKWVVFVRSSLKHEQLGLDKYQSGRIIILLPSSKGMNGTLTSLKDLFIAVEDQLTPISEYAIHPFTASYFHMTDKISRYQHGTDFSVAKSIEKYGIMAEKSNAGLDKSPLTQVKNMVPR